MQLEKALPQLVMVFALASASASAQVWLPMGPPGGDVRSLTSAPHDPHLLYLGTTDGHIFGSTDGGSHWQILGRAGPRLDGIVASLLVDPRDSRVLYAAVWALDPNAGGGVFRSEDGGRTWHSAGLAGQAVRALAQAPSEPDMLVAGTLDGVYRSRDASKTWQRISPPGHAELRNLDSVAIDPGDPEIIYIGTFHLPWRTSDGGERWAPIHSGMIDDSDVFSMEIDRANPQRIYASACSGIYRTDNAGALWKKIQGIPFSARRTPVLLQDPDRPATVYAGTTEGLWETVNSGVTWRRRTPPTWVINALAIVPGKPGRVVVGTDRLGVLVSDDAGLHFRASNAGFDHRQVVSLALDRAHPRRVLAVLANSPEPTLVTDNAGRAWRPLGPGLSAEGLRRVYASPDGWWASLERGGLMRYDARKGGWVRAGVVLGEAAANFDPTARRVLSPRRRPLASVVNDMAFGRSLWFAATDDGLFASRDRGATWSLFPFAPLNLPVSAVRISYDGRRIWVVSLRGMVFSSDGGKRWAWHDLPYESGGALRLDIADRETLLASSHNGLYISRDAGQHWQLAAAGLPAAPVEDLAITGDVFLASMQTGGLYISYDRGQTWARIEGTLAEGYFPVVTTRGNGSVIYAGSATDGLYAVELAPRSLPARTGRQATEP